MDYQNKKDNKKDNEVFNKETKNNSPIDYFSNNYGFVYVYKKTEKLGTALYMVTNLFNDSEPMKWTLRTKISHLLSFVLGFKDVFSIKSNQFSDDIKTKVLEIVSLLEIASLSGLISSMNFSILKDEFLNLINFLDQLKNNNNISFGSNDLKKNFFDVNKDSHNYKIIKDKDLSIKDNYGSGDVVSESHRKTNRQNAIIGLLKKGGWLSIAQLSANIKDCSEKTIQRELNNLILRGLVKKEGERRWSKYAVV